MSDLKIGKKESFTPIGVITRNSNVFQFPTAQVPKVEKPLSQDSLMSSLKERNSTSTIAPQGVETTAHSPAHKSTSTADTQTQFANSQQYSNAPQNHQIYRTSFGNQLSTSTSSSAIFPQLNQQLNQIHQLNHQVHNPLSHNFGSISSQQSNFKQWPMRMPGIADQLLVCTFIIWRELRNFSAIGNLQPAQAPQASHQQTQILQMTRPQQNGSSNILQPQKIPLLASNMGVSTKFDFII